MLVPDQQQQIGQYPSATSTSGISIRDEYSPGGTPRSPTKGNYTSLRSSEMCEQDECLSDAPHYTQLFIPLLRFT